MTVSHHFLRRTARNKADRLNKDPSPGFHYTVVRAERGPYRWRVVQSRL